MWRKNDFVGPLEYIYMVTSRKDRSTRGTVGAGVDWTSFAKHSFSRYMNIGNPGSLSETSSLTPHILLQVTSRKDRSTRGTVGAGVD
ncbi:hypothetical protein F2Q70_00023251 [Brassica cretica]|uniref:Uncharacterized protein n=1 Tax=Brassica cretica TaxID=69181 RepID=A0A8S9GJC9_BRACR|nr:hypothetical protein F2Q70_00023251 [Brassica cretica]